MFFGAFFFRREKRVQEPQRPLRAVRKENEQKRQRQANGQAQVADVQSRRRRRRRRRRRPGRRRLPPPGLLASIFDAIKRKRVEMKVDPQMEVDNNRRFFSRKRYTKHLGTRSLAWLFF